MTFKFAFTPRLAIEIVPSLVQSETYPQLPIENLTPERAESVGFKSIEGRSSSSDAGVYCPSFAKYL